MAWEGYFQYAGTEIINTSRTEAYAKAAGIWWFKPVYKNESLATMLGETYTTPRQDDAPWTDPDREDSYEFYGFYPLSVEGIEDSTRESTVIESTKDGGVPGRIRHATKAVTFNGLLVAGNECSAEYGMQWLRNALLAAACAGGPSNCSGEDLCYLSCSPSLDLEGTQEESHAKTVVRTNLIRNPSFEAGLTGWAVGSGDTITSTTVQAFSGASSLQATATGATSFSVFVPYNAAHQIPVVAGETYALSAYTKAATVARSARVDIRWYDSAGVLITTAAGTAAVNKVTDWTRLSGVLVAPANAAYAGPVLNIISAGGAGEVHYFDAVLLEKSASVGTYFDGSTTDGGGFEYDWTAAANNSASTQSIPASTAETDCLDDYRRSLHKVVVNSGPTILRKFETTDGGAIWNVQFTAVAGNPFEFGSEQPILVGFLDPQVTNPWYGGTAPDGASVDLDGDIFDEAQCAVTTYSPIVDPLCPAIIPPPAPPSLSIGCYTPPANWRRRQLVLPKQFIPTWGEVVPLLRVHARDSEVRNLRLRFYADYNNDGSAADDPCAYCGDIVVSYVPVGSTLTFDAALEQVYVTSPGGVRRRGDSLVFKTDGTPFDWPRLSCGFGYVVTFDLPQTQTPPVLDFSLIARSN